MEMCDLIHRIKNSGYKDACWGLHITFMHEFHNKNIKKDSPNELTSSKLKMKYL